MYLKEKSTSKHFLSFKNIQRLMIDFEKNVCSEKLERRGEENGIRRY